MNDIFEAHDWDAAGRIGRLSVPRAGVTVETPTIMPVVNPHIQTIPPRELAERFGAQILITNSYILHGSDDLREDALEKGLHDLLDFPGAIMTDSGSFQLSEYGEIDVTSAEILDFQREIGSDIATPVDIPTAPDTEREAVEIELGTTQERLDAAAEFSSGKMLVSAPVQGSTYTDLRESAGEHAAETGLDVFPVGAVVPLMNDYRYGEMIDVVMAAKRGLGPAAPVHLFGAGHPMMFALAVAAGCDLFDSAAYAIYARDGRYLTVRGTEHLEELEYFPCSCPVCAEHTPAGVEASDERERLLSEHNLYVTFAEIRRIKAAIREGNLLELVETRARGHPAMLDGYRALLAHSEQLERTDPASKSTFFYLSGESARRPEVLRHHRRLERLSVPDSLLLADGSVDGIEADEVWTVRPPFGPVPPELSETYPVNAELPDRLDGEAYALAARGVARLAEANPDCEVTLVAGWPEVALAALPEHTNCILIS
ncbi:tRNA-guanine(15) transglycosylase [Halalkalicoccus paucihalophilus]|uniref:tRNA-guanine(15) transglycosylase n=1 Tax=Halalkalicoccus paucihalophilus TaxID=1008153 RepID=A0A151AF41_9EURY|nr:tRNA guanosine(15) transglycosylase TgtA [Halalkalicoccus paucihalophilus]KYH26195.1 tRNA-guanine(15) transglycosylase [Halalkalicoccus paucihalophilus]